MKKTLQLFKRANFFPGLQAGPVYWNAIEDYHFAKETLYNELFHGFGIVPDYLDSLHVQAEKTKGGLITLLVGRGVAFDGAGKPLFLYEPRVLVLDPKKFKLPTTVYIILQYKEDPVDYYQNKDNSDLQGYQKRLETVEVDIVSEIHESGLSVELARIQLSDEVEGGLNTIQNNDNFCDPGVNTLDYRFIPWANRTKKGISNYLQKFLIEVFEYTRSVASSSYEVLPLIALRNLQTVAMTAKMIMQTSGVFFDDVIHLAAPFFDIDHQILFEIAEYEREHEEIGHKYTSKNSYEAARIAMYALGDAVKSYKGSYEEVDILLKNHRDVMENLRQVLIIREVSSDDIKYISYKMPHVLLFGEERYTLVDTLIMSSKESVEAHSLEFIDCSHPSVSNEAFHYPDGMLVHDTVRRWIGGSMQFRIKNVVKGRKTLIIRRTDMHQGNYSTNVILEKTESRLLYIDGVDTANRWRNLFVKYDEGEIQDFSPVIKFSIGEKGRDNSGSIWVYQIL